MKKILLIFMCTILSTNIFAQARSLTTGVGVLNAKVRVQYEHGFGDMHSTGVNLGYYLENWAGPRAEAFYRIYFGGDNEKGMFFQASGGVGSFSYLFEGEGTFDWNGQQTNYLKSNRFLTTGGGIAFGGKMTSRGGFVFESTTGFQLWSAPGDNYTEEADEWIALGNDIDAVFENAAFYVLGPGFPLHFQIKLGYNF